MAMINLSSIADQTQYLQKATNLSVDEAKKEALKQHGFEGELPTELNAELDKLINNEHMTEMSNVLGNDSEKLINRRSTEVNAEHEVNPTPPTENTGELPFTE
jgi:hypothetical protein